MLMVDGLWVFEVVCGVNLLMLFKFVIFDWCELCFVEVVEFLWDVGWRLIWFGLELIGRVILEDRF